MLLPKVAFFFSLSALSGADQIPLTAPDASPFTPDFDKLVTDTLDYWHTPGISVAVVAGDKTFSKVCSSMAQATGPLKFTGLRHRDLP